MFGLVVFLGIIPLIALFTKQQNEQTRKAWSAAAERLGLRVELGGAWSRPSMRGTVDGVDIEVEVYLRGSGDSKSKYTRYKAQHPPVGPPVVMRRQGAFSFLRQFVGGVDVQVGDPFFDNRVIIEASDPAAVTEFLSPSRKAVALQLFESYTNVRITSRSITIETRGVTRDVDELVRKVNRVLDAATVMAGAQPVDAALERRERGELSGAAQDLHAFNEGEPNSFSQLLEAETLVELGDHDGALGVLDRAEGRIGGDSSVAGWRAVAKRPPPPPPRGLPQPPPSTASPSRPPLPPPLPVPTPAARTAPPQQQVIDDLFDRGLLSFEVVERFETTYAGAEVAWTGEVIGADRYRTDLDFGPGPGMKATILLGSAGTSQMISTRVHAVAAFGDGTELERGTEVRFRGELIRVDRLTRRFYVGSAELLPD